MRYNSPTIRLAVRTESGGSGVFSEALGHRHSGFRHIVSPRKEALCPAAGRPLPGPHSHSATSCHHGSARRRLPQRCSRDASSGTCEVPPRCSVSSAASHGWMVSPRGTYRVSCVPSSPGGHLGGHFLAVMSDATVTLCVQSVCVDASFHFSWVRS